MDNRPGRLSSGVILPVVMLLLVFLGTLLASFTASINLSIKTAANIKSEFIRRQLLESSVYETLYALTTNKGMPGQNAHTYNFEYNNREKVYVEIVPEHEKIDINSVGEEEIARLIMIITDRKSSKPTSLLRELKKQVIYSNAGTQNPARRYKTVSDVDRRGYLGGFNYKLSRYFTVYHSGLRNIYSLYPSIVVSDAMPVNDSVAYVKLSAAMTGSYMIIEWMIN